MTDVLIELLDVLIELLEIELFWSFNRLYLQNVFTNHIFDIYVKTGFTIK